MAPGSSRVLAVLLALAWPLLAAGPAAAAVVVTCPDVAGRLGVVPAAARDQVAADLAQLERDLDDVNARLAREPDQAESQLQVIRDRRIAVIDRIVVDITRVGGDEPAGVRALAPCSLGEPAPGAPPPEPRPEPEPPATDPPPPHDIDDRATPAVPPSLAPAAVDGGAPGGRDADPPVVAEGGAPDPVPPPPLPAASAATAPASQGVELATDPLVVVAVFVIALGAVTALTLGVSAGRRDTGDDAT
jgi:hypothetical protein